MMKALLIALCILHSVSAMETQIWNRDTLQVPINDSLDIRIQTAFRWRNTDQLFKKFAQMFFDISLPHAFTLSPSYRQNIQKSHRGHWYMSAEPMIDLTKPFLSYCSWRTRLQYSSHSNAFFFRNQFQVFYPFIWDQFQLSLFLSEEFFVLYFKQFTENRVGGGLRFLFGPHLQISIYDLYRVLKHRGPWKQNNVYNFEIAIQF